jgi:hypothetical protein
MPKQVSNDSDAAQTLRPDGQLYVFEMIYSQGRWRAYADTPVELLDFLVHGYAELTSPVERTQARIRYAVDTQVVIQADLIANGDLDSCSPDERAILLGSRAEPPAISEWSAPIPLVLVSSFYAPIGPAPRPEGDDIWWIDPSTEMALLETLHAIGWIGLARRTVDPQEGV